MKTKNSVAIVTGGSSEVGLVIAERLADLGMTVYLTSRSKVAVNHSQIITENLDLTSDQQCQNLVKKIIQQHQQINVLVNVAGVTKHGPALSESSQELMKLFDINVLGAYRLILAVAPHMPADGHIINITSLCGLVALPKFGLYSATKFGLEALGQSLYFELKKSNLHLTNIAPGAIAKDQQPKVEQSLRQRSWFFRTILPMVSKQKLSQTVVRLIEDHNPPMQVSLGMDAQLANLSRRFLPQRVWIWLVSSLMR